jgi:hypothetical protein
VTRGVETPKDSAPRCASICRDLGLELDAVVVMANNVGCVCAPMMPESAPAPTPAMRGGSTAGGMAAILLHEEKDRQQRERSNDDSRRRRLEQQRQERPRSR